MIQRIQSVFLFLSAISFGGLFLVPMAKGDVKAATFFADGLYQVTDHMALMAITGLGIASSLICLFVFKSRGLQIRLSYLTISIALILSLTAYLLLSGAGDGSAIILAGAFLPVISIVCLWLAIVYIRKDEKLVRSMDRLR